VSTHEILAASGAPIWGHCPGSVRAQADIPNPETDASREGTATHWVAETVLRHARDNVGQRMTCEMLLGERAPNGVLIDDKMVEGAQMFVDDVLAISDSHQATNRLLIEHKVMATSIHPTDCGGTLDAALVLPEKRLVVLWDYKNGHRRVKAFDNDQMIVYLRGLEELFKLTGAHDQAFRAQVRIVQPFSYDGDGPVNVWDLEQLALIRAPVNRLNHAAQEALGPSPKLTTGNWCRDCRALFTCEAARGKEYLLFDYVGLPYRMDSMTGAELATERQILLDGIPVATRRLEAIEAEIGHRLQRGEPGVGLVLESRPGDKKWNVPDAQVIALMGQLGIDAAKTKLLTPVQTLALAPKDRKPMVEQIINTVTARPAGSLKLKPASESKVARAFQPRTGE
jgi:hypothetical protein